jgi:aspartate/glutamate racemase
MQGRFYPDVLSAADIEVVVPRADEQSYIHDKYVHELLMGHFLPTTRDGLLSIVEDMRARDRVDAILLAGTELPLLLTVGTAASVPLLDTTDIHVKAAVAAAWV